MQKLELETLRTGNMPGLTSSVGGMMAEAAAVCLEDQNHSNGIVLKVEGNYKVQFDLYWDRVTDQMRRCHNDLEETTEYGAYGIAFLLVQNLTDYSVVERSCKGTGFDYWLGRESDGVFVFQNTARLEVSGIRKGNQSRVRARVNKKLKQTDISDGIFAALIVVVEFSNPLSHMVTK